MDDQQSLFNETEPHADAAAEAFAGLAERVATMEGRLEGRMAMMTRALEHIAIEKQSIEIPDYTSTLVRMNGNLTSIAAQTKEMQASPALQITPESMAERIGEAARTARKGDDAAFRQWDRLLDARVRQVETIIGTADTIDQQKTMLLIVGGITGFTAFLMGIFLPVIFLRALPASWQKPEEMATWVMGEPTLAEAGARLLRTGDPIAWQAVTAAAEMRRANRDAITACERATAKTKQAVRCSLKITEPQ